MLLDSSGHSQGSTQIHLENFELPWIHFYTSNDNIISLLKNIIIIVDSKSMRTDHPRVNSKKNDAATYYKYLSTSLLYVGSKLFETSHLLDYVRSTSDPSVNVPCPWMAIFCWYHIGVCIVTMASMIWHSIGICIGNDKWCLLEPSLSYTRIFSDV